MDLQENDHLILVSGKSATGKSASLMNFRDPKGVVYLNCEAGKKLPFKSKFNEAKVTDPEDIFDFIEEAEGEDSIHTIIIDSLTFLMDMYESQYVLTAADSRSAWGDYAAFFKRLMQKYVAPSNKTFIFLAHTADVVNDDNIAETCVKVKGSLMNTGIESYFSTVVSTKKMPVKKLEEYDSDLLEITPEEEALGFKYVYQTVLTKATVNERIRSPLKMWDTKETFIDNCAQSLVDRLHEYYDEE